MKILRYSFTALVLTSSAITVGSFAGVEAVQDFRDEAWNRTQGLYASVSGLVPSPDRTMEDVRELAASDADHIIREAAPWIDKLNRQTVAAFRFEASVEAALELQDDFKKWQEESISLIDKRKEELHAQECYEDTDSSYNGTEAYDEYSRLLYAAVDRSGLITRADLMEDTGTSVGMVSINTRPLGECAPAV
ncbi:MAG: hypothetical protein OXL97_09275 [Chloroflexota bacterium]|nr:hypothetical protein [Chloroflexota bacterium]MDE2885017.1 hypothetical protein [Chloroflexota bacterium]